MTANVENDALFSSSMTVCMKESKRNTFRKMHLKIDVILNTTIDCKQTVIRVCDQNDPFFLYIISVNEQIFSQIKATQNLLIDFNSFGKTFSDLLQTCIEEESKDNARFIVSLSELEKDVLNLEILEMNAIKHLVHISLRIPAANHAFIRSSFTTAFQKLKSENQTLEKSLSSLQLQMNQISIVNANEMQNIKSQYELSLNETISKYNIDLKNKNDLITEMIEKENEYKLKIEELSTKLVNLQQSLIREEELRRDIELRNTTQLNGKIMTIEDELNKVRQLFNIEKNERTRMQALCEKQDKAFDESQQNIELLTQDLLKANEIIRKLQTEVQATHDKLTLLNKVAAKQDEMVNHKQSRLEKLEQDLRLCTQQINVKDDEYKNMLKQLESLKKTCDSSEAQLRENENIIELLTNQITQLQSKHGVKSNLTKVKNDAKQRVQTNNIFMNKNSKQLTDPFIRTNI